MLRKIMIFAMRLAFAYHFHKNLRDRVMAQQANLPIFSGPLSLACFQLHYLLLSLVQLLRRPLNHYHHILFVSDRESHQMNQSIDWLDSDFSFFINRNQAHQTENQSQSFVALHNHMSSHFNHFLFAITLWFIGQGSIIYQFLTFFSCRV